MKTKLLASIAALFSLVVFAVSANVVPAALIRMAGDFEIEVTLLANISAVQFVGFIIATIIGGLVADYLGKKHVFQLACALTVGGALICGVSPNLIIIYCGCFLMGTGGGILESLSSALLADLFPDHRKFTLNASQVAYCLGAIGGPFLMGWLLPMGFSWRLFFGMICIMGLVLWLLFFLADIPQRKHEDKINFEIALDIIHRWSFVIPCVIIFLYVFAETSIVIFINPYLFEVCGAPENWAIYGIAIFWGTMTIGRFLCAFIPEKVSTSKAIIFLMAMTAASLIGHFSYPTWQTALVLFAVTGFFFAGTWPLIVELNVARNPQYSGTVVGVTVAAGAVGCVTAPPIVGSLFSFIPAPCVFGFLAIPLVIGIILALTGKNNP